MGNMSQNHSLGQSEIQSKFSDSVQFNLSPVHSSVQVSISRSFQCNPSPQSNPSNYGCIDLTSLQMIFIITKQTEIVFSYIQCIFSITFSQNWHFIWLCSPHVIVDQFGIWGMDLQSSQVASVHKSLKWTARPSPSPLRSVKIRIFQSPNPVPPTMHRIWYPPVWYLVLFNPFLSWDAISYRQPFKLICLTLYPIGMQDNRGRNMGFHDSRL